MQKEDYYAQSLVEGEHLPEADTLQFVEAEYCEHPEKSVLRWSWDNLEKIVSLLTILYFLALIAKIAFTSEPAIGLAQESTQERAIRNRPFIKYQTLPSVSNVKDTQNEVFIPSSSEYKGEREKQALFYVQNIQSVSKNNVSPNSQDNHAKATQSSTENNNNQYQSSKPLPSFLTPYDKQYILRNSLRQALKDQQQSKAALKYQIFSKIYEEINEYLHKSIHSPSREERQEAIAVFLSNKENKNEFLEQQLKQNDRLEPKRTKQDSLYLQKLSEDYEFSQKDQLSLCVVLSTRNNAYNDQIKRTLNSIFNQQYSNYQLIISDSASSDSTVAIASDYLVKNNKTQNTKIVRSDSRSSPFSILQAVQHCGEGSFVVMLDGSTELVGKQVFNIIDSQHRLSGANLIYSDYYNLDVDTNHFRLAKAHKYEESEKFMLLYRNIPKDYGKIVVSKVELVSRVSSGYVKFNGKALQYTGIDSLAYSLLELSCGDIRLINEPLAFSISDSALAKQQASMRQRESEVISSKLKFDIC